MNHLSIRANCFEQGFCLGLVFKIQSAFIVFGSRKSSLTMEGRSNQAWSSLSEMYAEQSPVVKIAAAALIGAAGLYYTTTHLGTRSFIDRGVDLKQQSVIINGRPEHRASCLSTDDDHMEVPQTTPECRNIYDLLLHGKKVSGNGKCLGTRSGPNREYVWMSYQEVIEKTLQFGSALQAKGLPAGQNTRVAIFSQNRPEWDISEYGCLAYSMVPVPLYDTLGFQACAHILNQCEMRLVVTDKAQKVETLFKLKKEHVPSLEIIVMVEPITPDLQAQADELGIELISYSDMLKLGQENMKETMLPKPTDVFYIIYTSGTTGNPKGVVVTHESFLTLLDSVLCHAGKYADLKPSDSYLSYLPLAHNFEQCGHMLIFKRGCHIGYYSGDVRKLPDDLMCLKPTLFISVPRLFNRVYDTVLTQVKSSRIKYFLFQQALASKTKELNKQIISSNTIWDRLVFKKIQQRLGGRVRIILCGSAPLSGDVLTFLRCALGCNIIEGYGQTEGSTGFSLGLPGDAITGHVGPPLPGCHIKLVDVPEMDYYAKDNIGEICAKSKWVMKEYFREPEKTAEVLDDDGWLHTGDIGSWTPFGALKIVDRKKFIFKLSQGEYISPEKIENSLTTSPFVAQIYVDGDSLKSCLMAILVPDVQYLETWAQNNGLPTDLKEFCKTPEAKKVILQDLTERGRKAGLKGFELVKDIYLESELFSVSNNLLTPTFKNKRPALKKKYKDHFSQLYAENGM